MEAQGAQEEISTSDYYRTFDFARSVLDDL